jgi:RNA polymerase II-associated factor 1
LPAGQHGGGASAAAGVELKCKIKYQNNLPDIPFDPKSIAYPFDCNRYIHYKPTSLEKQFKWDILNEQDLGIRIDLIDQDYNKYSADC